MRITTTYHGPTVYPRCAWTAIDEDTYDGAPDSKCAHMGFGNTELEAVQDLMLILEEEEEEPTTTKYHRLLVDFTVMVDNEIQRIKTGRSPGPSMRDAIGQWESLVREARTLLILKEE